MKISDLKKQLTTIKDWLEFSKKLNEQKKLPIKKRIDRYRKAIEQVQAVPQSTVEQWNMFAKRNREMKREKSSVIKRMEKENEEMEERIRQCVRIETDRKNPLAEICKEINMQRNLDNWLRQDEGVHAILKAKRLEEMYGDDIYKDAPLITGENKNGRITSP